MRDINFKKAQVGVYVGRPRLGKSNAVKYHILRNTINKKPLFKFGIVFTRTKFNEGYDYIPQQYIYTEYKPSILRKYMNGLEKMKNEGKKIPRNFVIFDDQQGLLNRNDPLLTNFVSSHRHYNSSIFFCFQYLYGASPLLRECSTYAICFRSAGNRTLQGLFENFGMLFDNFNDFKKHFFKVTKKPYRAMMYIQDINELKDNYLQFKAVDMSAYNGLTLDF